MRNILLLVDEIGKWLDIKQVRHLKELRQVLLKVFFSGLQELLLHTAAESFRRDHGQVLARPTLVQRVPKGVMLQVEGNRCVSTDKQKICRCASLTISSKSLYRR